MLDKYPRLLIDRKAIRDNTKKIISWCGERGIFVSGVIKGAGGIEEVAKEMEKGGVKIIASSRIEQLERCKNAGVKLPMMMLRVPMLSEIPRLIKTCEYSLNSELEVINKINEEVLKDGGSRHKVILMSDLGDLREGFFDDDELLSIAVKIEKEFKGIELAGIGTNLGCYGSVIPTKDKMKDLRSLSERIEEAIDRKLEIVSGGASSSLIGVFDDYIDGINMLRIGSAIITGPYDEIRTVYGRKEIDELECPFKLEAEIIEIKKKPSYPIGKLGVDAYGNKGVYIDRGIRKRALLAVGRADYGDITSLVPEDDKVELIGASGDHTIIDIENCENAYKIGDILKFELKYSAILNLSSSENVNIVFN